MTGCESVGRKAEMPKTVKEEILDKLRTAPRNEPPPRPVMPPLNELALNREGLIEKLAETLSLIGCAVHRVRDSREALDKLTEIARAEGLTRVLVSEDDVVAPLDLPEWGRKSNVEVVTPKDCQGREEFKRVAFEDVQAGITGVDFAVAESGTLCLVHGEGQPRLVSLAPIRHIAFVPTDRIRPVYESVTEEVFAEGGKAPSHVTFISGPSMTGDIQATLFQGMHGPKTVTVILVG
jgi:L-lactate dehydrogenase complex protein LldG